MRTMTLVLAIAMGACAAESPPAETAAEHSLKNGNCHWENDACVCVGSPIVIDLQGNGYQFTDAAGGVPFHLTPGRPARQWSWPAPGSDDAFLALPGTNGIVDNGGELFGDNTLQAMGGGEPNGFTALKMYDGNHDGRIDHQDDVYSQLRLWIDQAPRDGYSQPSELFTLDSAGIASISLGYAPAKLVDAFGNDFRYAAPIEASPPVAGVAHDVFLTSINTPSSDQIVPGGTTQDYTEYTCWAWWYAVQWLTPVRDATTACDNQYTSNDPLATAGGGRLSKMVARYATSTTSQTSARLRANDTVASAVLGPVSPPPDTIDMCFGWDFPANDLFRAEPYDVVGSHLSPRIQCTATTVITGGGGSTGCQ